jgi:hypothetical protein
VILKLVSLDLVLTENYACLLRKHGLRMHRAFTAHMVSDPLAGTTQVVVVLVVVVLRDIGNHGSCCGIQDELEGVRS